MQMEVEVHALHEGTHEVHRLACFQSQKDRSQFATPSAAFTHLKFPVYFASSPRMLKI